MIYETFPAEHPIVERIGSTNSHTTLSAADRAARLKITIDEFHRRNKIVVDLFRQCSVRAGLSYLPMTPKAAEQYGVCKVEKIFRDYWDFPIHEDWPKDDAPYIITLRPERGTKNGGLILCTSNWLNPLSVTPK